MGKGRDIDGADVKTMGNSLKIFSPEVSTKRSGKKLNETYSVIHQWFQRMRMLEASINKNQAEEMPWHGKTLHPQIAELVNREILPMVKKAGLKALRYWINGL